MFKQQNISKCYHLRKMVDAKQIVAASRDAIRFSIAKSTGRSSKAVDEALGTEFDKHYALYIIDALAVNARLSLLTALKQSSAEVATAITGQIINVDGEISKLAALASRYTFPSAVAKVLGQVVATAVLDDGSLIVNSVGGSSIIADFSESGKPSKTDDIKKRYDISNVIDPMWTLPTYYTDMWFLRLSSLWSDIIQAPQYVASDQSHIIALTNPDRIELYATDEDDLFLSGFWYLVDTSRVVSLDHQANPIELDRKLFLPNPIYQPAYSLILPPSDKDYVMHDNWWNNACTLK